MTGQLADSQHATVVENMGLVFDVVKERLRSREDVDDLVQEGAKGLMEAVRTHHLNPAVPFGPYASVRIKRFIYKYLAENRPIRVPLNSFKGKTVAWKAAAAAVQALSLEAINAERGNGEGVEPVDERTNETEVDEKREAVARAMDELPDGLKEQIKCIYLDEIGLRAYAREVGCCYRHLLRRRDKAFEVMRRSLESQGWEVEGLCSPPAEFDEAAARKILKLSLRQAANPAKSGPVRRQSARNAALYAEKLGMIHRPAACEGCADDTVILERHHTDYDQPLVVVYLCPSCHDIADAEMRSSEARTPARIDA